MLIGCSGSNPEENAECAKGSTRELVCGRYSAGVQQQFCGPRFLWVNEGECQDSTVCEHEAVREESCGGLNGNAYREQQCNLGFWPETWSDCIEPDECQNGAETEFSCAGGLNDQATRTHLCEEEQARASTPTSAALRRRRNAATNRRAKICRPAQRANVTLATKTPV